MFGAKLELGCERIVEAIVLQVDIDWGYEMVQPDAVLLWPSGFIIISVSIWEWASALLWNSYCEWYGESIVREEWAMRM